MSAALTDAGVYRLWVNAKLKQDNGAGSLAVLIPGGVPIFEAHERRPEGTPNTFLVWQITSGPFPHRSNGATVGYTDARLSITVWSRKTSDYRVIEPIIARHKFLFNGAAGNVSGGVVFGCEWIADYDAPDDTPDANYPSIGTVTDYRTWAQRA